MTQKIPPIHARMARDHLRLSRECLERAYDLDPTLRPRGPARMATDSAPAFDEEAIIERALRANHSHKGYNMSRSRPSRAGLIAVQRKLFRVNQLMGARMALDASGQAGERMNTIREHLRRCLELLDGEAPADDERTETERDKATAEASDGARDAWPTSFSSGEGFDANQLFQRI